MDILDKTYWREKNEDPTDEVKFYTDGTKTEKGLFATVYGENQEQNLSFRLPIEFSIFQAEIMPIQNAAVLAHNIKTAGKTIHIIFKDSPAALKAIN